MKKYKTIKEMRQDQDLMNLVYGEYVRVLIGGKEYIVSAIDGTYNDIIEDFFYKALESINKEFEINELPVPKRYSLKDAMFETCVALRDKMLEEYAEAGINFINVREEQDDGMIYENLEDDSTEISGVTTGTVLTIEGKKYTVIEQVEDSKYKVLATDLANDSNTMQFGSNNNYESSTIATYLDNDYYNSLDPKIQNAIIETPVQQKDLKDYEGNNSTDWDTPKDAGTHKVFLPSWDELTKAAKSTDPTTLKKFLNSKYVWLRDTCGIFMLYVGSNGSLFLNGPGNVSYVRPAFVIDLSKVKCKEYKPLLGKSDIKFLAPLLIPYTGVPATMKKILTTAPCLNGAVTEFYVLRIESKSDGCPLVIIPLTVATPNFDLLDTNMQYELDVNYPLPKR